MPHVGFLYDVCACLVVRLFLCFVFLVALVGYMYVRRTSSPDTVGIKILRFVGWAWLLLASVPIIFFYFALKNSVLESNENVFWKPEILHDLIVYLAFALGPVLYALFMADRLGRRSVSRDNLGITILLIFGFAWFALSFLPIIFWFITKGYLVLGLHLSMIYTIQFWGYLIIYLAPGLAPVLLALFMVNRLQMRSFSGDTFGISILWVFGLAWLSRVSIPVAGRVIAFWSGIFHFNRWDEWNVHIVSDLIILVFALSMAFAALFSAGHLYWRSSPSVALEKTLLRVFGWVWLVLISFPVIAVIFILFRDFFAGKVQVYNPTSALLPWLMTAVFALVPCLVALYLAGVLGRKQPTAGKPDPRDKYSRRPA